MEPSSLLVLPKPTVNAIQSVNGDTAFRTAWLRPRTELRSPGFLWLGRLLLQILAYGCKVTKAGKLLRNYLWVVSANSTIESRVVVRKNRPPASCLNDGGRVAAVYVQTAKRFGSRLRLITTPLVVWLSPLWLCGWCLQSEYRCAMRRMGDSLRKEMMPVVAGSASPPEVSRAAADRSVHFPRVTRLLRVYNCDYIRPPHERLPGP
jgi:hypothetical protein